MAASIITGSLLCLFLQDITPAQLGSIMFYGFTLLISSWPRSSAAAVSFPCSPSASSLSFPPLTPGFLKQQAF